MASFCGSPAYLSPEMIDRKGINEQADIYALGVMMYEMLYGETPFFSSDLDELFANIKKNQLAFPTKVVS